MALGGQGAVSLCEAFIWSNFVFVKLLSLLTTHTDRPLPVPLGPVSSVHKWDCEKVGARVYQSLDVTPLLQISLPSLSLRASPQRCCIFCLYSGMDSLNRSSDFPKLLSKTTCTASTSWELNDLIRLKIVKTFLDLFTHL